MNKIGDHKEDNTYPCSAYVKVVYGDDVASETPPSEYAPDYRLRAMAGAAAGAALALTAGAWYARRRWLR